MPLFPSEPPATNAPPNSPGAQRRNELPEFDNIDTLKEELGTASYELREAGINYARKKHAFHAAKAKAFLQVFGAKNADERNAKAFANYSQEMLDAELAEAERDACLELVRSLRQMLSAEQTKIAAAKSIANSIHYGHSIG